MYPYNYSPFQGMQPVPSDINGSMFECPCGTVPYEAMMYLSVPPVIDYPPAPYLYIPMNDFDDFTDDTASYHDVERQPQNPIVSNPEPIPFITLRKELNGYPNYGNPSGSADILYTGTQGTYTFRLPAFFSIGNMRATLIIRGVLDDHYTVPESNYSLSVTVNDRRIFNGRVPFVHGRPAGQRFTNWQELRINVTNLRRNNTIQIRNTSRAGNSDWIGIDWLELRFNES